MRRCIYIMWLIMAVLVPALLSGCLGEVVYAERYSVDRGGWHFQDTVSFTPVIERGGEPYDVIIWVRHDKDYEYSNLWLRIISEEGVVNDTSGLIEMQIADRTGKWLGECARSLCTRRLTLTSSWRPSDPAAFRMQVMHYMREASLAGIRDIGVEIVHHRETAQGHE